MKTNSNLSILIANYNNGSFSDILLQSINRQSTQPEKIIIIDDGFTNNSHQILSKYIKNDQFKIILSSVNAGVINLMNKKFVHRNFFKMLKLIRKINYKTHKLEKFIKTFKLLTKLYYLKNFQFYEKNGFFSFFKKFLFLISTNLYFLKESPLFFYHLNKIRYSIINIDKKNDLK